MYITRLDQNLRQLICPCEQICKKTGAQSLVHAESLQVFQEVLIFVKCCFPLAFFLSGLCCRFLRLYLPLSFPLLHLRLKPLHLLGVLALFGRFVSLINLLSNVLIDHAATIKLRIRRLWELFVRIQLP